MITMVMNINFGIRLKELRQENSLSQRKLAKALGMAQSSITAYEAEQKSPTADVIIRASQYFHVSADYLLGLSDDPLGGAPEHIKKELLELKDCKKELEEFRSMFLQVEKAFNHFKKTYEEQKNDS